MARGREASDALRCTDVAISASASSVSGSWWLTSCVGSGYAGVPSSYLVRMRVGSVGWG